MYEKDSDRSLDLLQTVITNADNNLTLPGKVKSSNSNNNSS